MRSSSFLFAVLSAGSASAFTTTISCRHSTSVKAATMHDDDTAKPKVIESIIGGDLCFDEEEETVVPRELTGAMAAALAVVPNLVLTAGLVAGWEDATVRALCAAALAARLATAVVSGASLQHGLASGPLALANGMRKVEPEEIRPLNLGTLSRVDDREEDCVISALQIVARKDKVTQVRTMLEAYFEDSAGEDTSIVQSSKNVFDVTTRFKCTDPNDSLVELRRHHVSDAFLELTEGCRAHLAIPIAIYIVTQRDGKLGNPRHPFGPGGEGGRDDAIYSSPANLDGSQVGSKIGLEAARTVDI